MSNILYIQLSRELQRDYYRTIFTIYHNKHTRTCFFHDFRAQLHNIPLLVLEILLENDTNSARYYDKI